MKTASKDRCLRREISGSQSKAMQKQIPDGASKPGRREDDCQWMFSGSDCGEDDRPHVGTGQTLQGSSSTLLESAVPLSCYIVHEDSHFLNFILAKRTKICFSSKNDRISQMVISGGLSNMEQSRINAEF